MSGRLPPGVTESLRAERVLVLAPHYDDEVLGCAGLLAQLAQAGAAVRVLFLSDGSGGVEEVADRAAYAARRRAESDAALAALGVAGAEHLGLPDGQLDRRIDEMAAAIRRALETQKPDLVLAPSPLESTSDHQAAFAALFRVLSPLRTGDRLHAALGSAQVLLYEVNHPGYPNLLVDTTADLPVLERAMAAYPSQQERHDYLAAAVGLRRYRALSLPPTVAAAEAYTRLAMTDFTTRGQARLVRDLGGVPELLEVREGPLVSLVVRTCERPALLAEALASIAASTYRRVEVVLVVDGGGAAVVPDGFPFPVRRVDLVPRRGRAGAANAGVEAATGALLGFLDDDDLLEPEHLATLVGALGAAGVRAAYSDAAVVIYELAGDGGGWREVERRLPYSRDFDADVLLLDNYLPLHTMLAEREMWRAAGAFDPELPFFEDWDLLIRMAALAPFHHLPQVTCEYRHFRGGGHVLGERPRERPDFLAMKQRVLERHRQRLTPEALARAVDRLRSEAVDAAEAAAAAQRSAREEGAARAAADRAHAAAERARDAAERARLAAEEQMHRHHGEAVAVGEENARLRAAVADQGEELQRLFRVEAELRGLLGDQDAHLGRTYAEIARLNRLLDEMRSTRAWRTHERLQRFRRGR
ncbi:MAG TPA: PIG-L family deacetylase [Thermoanaerobaculia bacterium]|jgi:LmbE family N-acetylglucosaminyl deacetylase|nr:PIG-L family deacetylase [Thermoanaerobaculia bacterium]